MDYIYVALPTELPLQIVQGEGFEPPTHGLNCEVSPALTSSNYKLITSVNTV